MRTKEKLANALTQAGAPEEMIEAARSGRYDDFEGTSASPICDLIVDAHKVGLDHIVTLAKKGEFDSSKEEAQEWFEREGKNYLLRGKG